MLTSWFLAETDLIGSKVVAELKQKPRSRAAASSASAQDEAGQAPRGVCGGRMRRN
jgi:hypothetical protein